MNTTGTKEKNPERSFSAPSMGPSGLDQEKATRRQQQQMQIPHDDKHPPSLPPPSRTKHAGKRSTHRRRRTGAAAEAVRPGPPPPSPTTIHRRGYFPWLTCFTFLGSCRVLLPFLILSSCRPPLPAPASSLTACHRGDWLWSLCIVLLRPSDLDWAPIAGCFKVRTDT